MCRKCKRQGLWKLPQLVLNTKSRHLLIQPLSTSVWIYCVASMPGSHLFLAWICLIIRISLLCIIEHFPFLMSFLTLPSVSALFNPRLLVTYFSWQAIIDLKAYYDYFRGFQEIIFSLRKINLWEKRINTVMNEDVHKLFKMPW